MADIGSITQLGVTAIETATSLTRTLGVGQNGTQPQPAAGPTSYTNLGVSAASLFSTSLGGKTTNTTALASIARNIVSPSGPTGAGSISSVADSASTISAASTALTNSGINLKQYSSAFSDQGLADIANAAFKVGSADLDLPGLTGEGALSSILGETTGGDEIPKDWIFITAPQQISWDKQGETAIVNTYGSNNPYVIYSTTGKRKLTLSDCLIEGFSAGKEVEDHVLKLEKLMTTVMNTQKGYVSPYVWDLRAGEKSYGKFIIESLNIQEAMRNKAGRADRATASITLQEVPDFQVNDGRDLATSADLASGTSVQSDADKNKTAESDAAAKKAGDKAKSGSGSGAGGEKTPSVVRGAGGGQITGATGATGSSSDVYYQVGVGYFSRSTGAFLGTTKP